MNKREFQKKYDHTLDNVIYIAKNKIYIEKWKCLKVENAYANDINMDLQLNVNEDGVED